MNTTTNTAAILDVVRGNAHWTTLRDCGIDVRRVAAANRWEFATYDCDPVVVSEADVVQGIKKQIGNEELLSEWAQFVLAASDLVDVAKLGDSDGGLLDCLWEISDGNLECARRFTSE